MVHKYISSDSLKPLERSVCRIFCNFYDCLLSDIIGKLNLFTFAKHLVKVAQRESTQY